MRNYFIHDEPDWRDPAALDEFDCIIARCTDPADLDALAERMIQATESAAIERKRSKANRRAQRGYGWGV